MQPDQPSPPTWLKDFALPVPASVLADAQAAATQAAADQVLRDLIAQNPDTDTLRRHLQDAMWTKASFNIVIDGRPLIHHIIDRGDLPTLLLVISGGREKEKFIRNGDTDQQARTALDYAHALGWDEGVKYLGLYGHTDTGGEHARVHNVQTQLDAVLAAAAEKNDLDVARAALALGGNANVKTRPDLSALHHCVLLLQGEMVTLLAQNGADLHARHFRGESTLQMLWWCHPPLRLNDAWYEMAERLRALGCDSTDFKTPREMTAQELTQELVGACTGSRAMDFALQARDFDSYRRGFATLGTGKADALLGVNSTLQEKPINFICRGLKLHEIMRAELWYGQAPSLRRVWAAAVEELSRPQQLYQWRDPNSRDFGADDFSRVIAQVDRQMLVKRANNQFKL